MRLIAFLTSANWHAKGSFDDYFRVIHNIVAIVWHERVENASSPYLHSAPKDVHKAVEYARMPVQLGITTADANAKRASLNNRTRLSATTCHCCSNSLVDALNVPFPFY